MHLEFRHLQTCNTCRGIRPFTAHFQISWCVSLLALGLKKSPMSALEGTSESQYCFVANLCKVLLTEGMPVFKAGSQEERLDH